MKLPNLKLFVTAVFTLGVMTFINAQQSEIKTEENSLLEAALKRSDAKSSNSLFYLNKVETNIDAVKKVPSENIKYVMVLTGNDVKKKFRDKGITQIVMVTTKD